MTPSQFKKARKKANLTRAQLAKALGVLPGTVWKWEADDGTRPPNPIACRVLEWILAGYKPPPLA